MPEPTTPSPALPGDQYTVVAWDLDTTGRRLIDEICQIGGYCKKGDGISFSQYVMPYRNPNPGARRSFGIKVVNIGRYRMLKDLASGKILKTKSEVSALQDFIAWLGEVKEPSSSGVILACHEPQRKVLVPLLLEALYKYNLMQTFSSVVSGFCNTSSLVSALGNKEKITSLSLRSLCKTVLNDTSLPTASATDRCKVLVDILSSCAGGEGEGGGLAMNKVLPFTNSLQQEEQQLKELKEVLGTQGTLRPIFEGQLKAKRLVRERAMVLRRSIAEAGLDYAALQAAVRDNSLRALLEKTGVVKEDLEESLALIHEHFNISEEGQNGTVLSKVSDIEPVNAESSP